MLAMEEWGQKLRKIANYDFFQGRCKDIQFFFITVSKC